MDREVDGGAHAHPICCDAFLYNFCDMFCEQRLSGIIEHLETFCKTLLQNPQRLNVDKCQVEYNASTNRPAQQEQRNKLVRNRKEHT